jgi:hypothetical protein
MGVVIAVPEIWAAVDDVAWPTISGTVAYLEYWHPWVAPIVVGLIVWGALSSVRIRRDGVQVLTANPEEDAGRELRRTPEGRLTIAKEWKPIRPWIYVPVALAIVIGLALVAYIDRPHDKILLGEVLYGSIALLWVVVPSVLAFFLGRSAPFPTLFQTAKDLEGHWELVAAMIAALLTILLIHIVLYPWPSIVPDLKDLHVQYQQNPRQHHVKKVRQPDGTEALRSLKGWRPATRPS